MSNRGELTPREVHEFLETTIYQHEKNYQVIAHLLVRNFDLDLHEVAVPIAQKYLTWRRARV